MLYSREYGKVSKMFNTTILWSSPNSSKLRIGYNELVRHAINYNEVERASDVKWGIKSKNGQVNLVKNTTQIVSLKKIHLNEEFLEFQIPLEESDRVYGSGEKYARLNRRGKRFVFWNSPKFHHLPTSDPTYLSIPFFIVSNSSRTYGIFVSNEGYISIDFGATDKKNITIKCLGSSIDLYVMDGPTMADVVREFTNIVGKQFLPPKWALGYHHSKYGFKGEGDVLNVIEKMVKHNIPCDSIWLDIDYMEDFADFTWNKSSFANYEQMIKQIHSNNLKLVTIVDVGIPVRENYPPFSRLLNAKGFLLNKEGNLFLGTVWPGICAFPDFMKHSVNEIWADLVSNWLDYGIDGIWLDMNEPSIFIMVDKVREMLTNIFLNKDSSPEQISTRLSCYLSNLGTKDISKFNGSGNMEAFHINDTNDRLEHKFFHNAYAFLESIATFRGFKQHSSHKRHFILSRSGFAGIQQYAAIWTGDNQSDWGQLQSSIPELLSLGISGVQFVGADVGGFSDDTDPELFIRWMQLGAFYPFFRNHNSNNSINQEPYSFGNKNEGVIKKAIELRYSLLPYLYLLFTQAQRMGDPIMRPMLYEFPTDSNTFNMDNQFMLGKNLLVAPVLFPGVGAISVYFPEGRWLNCSTEQVFSSGWHQILVGLEDIPMFIKENGYILRTTPIIRASEKWHIIVEAFVTSQAIATIYDDDGESDYNEQGNYFEADIHFVIRNNDLYVDSRIKQDKYRNIDKKVSIRVFTTDIVKNLYVGSKLQSFKDNKTHITFTLYL